MFSMAQRNRVSTTTSTTETPALHHHDYQRVSSSLEEQEEEGQQAEGEENDCHLNHDQETPAPAPSLTLAFGVLGLLNNAPYVIMLASAKTLAEGGVAVVYLANIAPGLLIKLSLPYWMDRVTYHTRLASATLLMVTAFVLVALFSIGQSSSENDAKATHRLTGQLCGVALVSLQCALGEANLLALAGKCDAATGRCLTWFAAGTGLAGPVGYFYKILMTEWWALSLPTTCATAAALFPAAYYGTYRAYVHGQSLATVVHDDEEDERNLPETGGATRRYYSDNDCSSSNQENLQRLPRRRGSKEATANHQQLEQQAEEGDEDTDRAAPQSPAATTASWSVQDRFWFVVRLWPYIVPLFVVYAAEYACQGGVWTAMSVPYTDLDLMDSRNTFYERSNWLYQAGVFVSRSSGNWFRLSLPWLWFLPGLQVVNLILFGTIATQQWPLLTTTLYRGWFLYGLAACTGLLGGAVYVHGYQCILHNVPAPGTEFALASVSMAESLGILVANVLSLVLQSCLYEVNHLDGALVQCPSFLRARGMG